MDTRLLRADAGITQRSLYRLGQGLIHRTPAAGVRWITPRVSISSTCRGPCARGGSLGRTLPNVQGFTVRGGSADRL